MLADFEVKNCAERALNELGPSFAGWKCNAAKYRVGRPAWLRVVNPFGSRRRRPLLDLHFTTARGKKLGFRLPVKNENPDFITQELQAILIEMSARRA